MKTQARAPKTIRFGSEAFEAAGKTVIRWLGNGGLFINSRGTCLMVDPLLEGYDMPLLIDMPIEAKDVPKLDAVLVTHSDGDHFSLPTCGNLSGVCGEYHSTPYVCGLMKENKLYSFGHLAGEQFRVGNIGVTVTPADHMWQNSGEFGNFNRVFMPEDCCGFLLETPDGTIWAPGDSRLMEAHLNMAAPDLILFDFSDDPYHIGFENAVRLANHYPDSILILSHWGSVDAPELLPFNGDPQKLSGRITKPGRVKLLAPGEPYLLV